MQTRTKTIHYYQDPRHGWIKIPITCNILARIANDITPWSYMTNSAIFLEEDGDASLYLDELKRLGIPFKIKASSTNRRSKIRSYSSYSNLMFLKIRGYFNANNNK